MLRLSAAVVLGPAHPLQLQLLLLPLLECEPASQQATQVPDTQTQADHTGLGLESAMPAKVTARVTSASAIGVAVCMQTAQAAVDLLRNACKGQTTSKRPISDCHVIHLQEKVLTWC